MPAGEPRWRKSLPAGINPIYGLYTAAFATAIGALLTGSSYLKVMLSNVLAVSLYSVLAPVPEADVPATPFVLTFLVGHFQPGFGLIRASARPGRRRPSVPGTYSSRPRSSGSRSWRRSGRGRPERETPPGKLFLSPTPIPSHWI